MFQNSVFDLNTVKILYIATFKGRNHVYATVPGLICFLYSLHIN